MKTDGREIKIKVTAPPADGRANQQVVKVLADRLKIAKGRVAIIAGLKSRNKRIRIDGLSRTEVQSLLNV